MIMIDLCQWCRVASILRSWCTRGFDAVSNGGRFAGVEETLLLFGCEGLVLHHPVTLDNPLPFDFRNRLKVFTIFFACQNVAREAAHGQHEGQSGNTDRRI